jgi:hypothetical protein
LEWEKDICSLSEILGSARKLKKEAQAFIEQFRKERKEKEASEASAHLHKIDDHLLKTEAAYQAKVYIWTKWLHKLRPLVVARVEREYQAVVRAGETTKTLRALQRTHKRSSANPNAIGMHLKDGDRRKLEILNTFQDEVVKATWSKNGAAAGYYEIGRARERALSDESWQGLLTAKEIQSRLVDAPGDKDAKEVRRPLKQLGIRPAEDQRGRKWKSPYLKKQKPKRSRGRPRTKIELVFTGNLEIAEADQLILRRGKACERLVTIRLERFRESGLRDKQLAKVKHPINHLPPNPIDSRLPLGVEAWEPKPERSPVFAAWMESIAKLDYPRWMDSITKLAYPVWMRGSLREILSYRWWLPNS